MGWGIHDFFDADKNRIRKYLLANHQTVNKMLKYFEEYDVASTWATVGAIACSNKGEYLSLVPNQPNYVNQSLKLNTEIFNDNKYENYFFAPELINKILVTPKQELASHSFSHLYFAEEGVTEKDFLTDMKNLETLWQKKFQYKPVSLVFPRNQVSFTNLLKHTSIKIWRENEKPFYYNFDKKDKLSRALRFIESINPRVVRSTYSNNKFTRNSLFVRFNLPNQLWILHMKRIKNELKKLTSNKVFHLYWHPHNLNFNTKLSFNRMIEVLDVINNARNIYGIQSISMKDLIKN